MVPEIISVGCKVEIRVLQQARREENEVVKSQFFVTKVADVDHKKDIIVVTVPIVAGLPKLLEQNLRYDFIFVTEYGLYRAEGQCIGRKKEGEILLNVLALTSKTAKFQRREYYRESCSIPVDFVEISNEVANLGTITEIQKATKNDDTLPDYGTILDISGGGIRYSTPYKVRTDVYNLYLFQIGPDLEGEALVGDRDLNLGLRLVATNTHLLRKRQLVDVLKDANAEVLLNFDCCTDNSLSLHLSDFWICYSKTTSSVTHHWVKFM